MFKILLFFSVGKKDIFKFSSIFGVQKNGINTFLNLQNNRGVFRLSVKTRFPEAVNFTDC